MVTKDPERTMAGLWRLGIGPWRAYTFTPENTTNQTYRGEPSPFVLRVCFAEVNGMVWEIISPVSGAAARSHLSILSSEPSEGPPH